jgi:hypothetical protein
MRHVARWGGVVVLLAVLAAGCSTQSGTTKDKAKVGSLESPEEQVKAKFNTFQQAFRVLLKEPNEDNARLVWDLLHTDSQLDADRAAKTIREEFKKADATEKATQEKALGLTAAELDNLSGLSFLRSKRFLGKYDEIPDSKLDKVTVRGDEASVVYIEPDNDQVTLRLARQDGQWKVLLPVPAATK